MAVYAPVVGRRPARPPTTTRALLGAFFILALAVLMIVIPNVPLSEHAKLHPEAVAIKACIDANGPSMVFRSQDKSTYYLACLIPDGPLKGRWGFQAITRAAKDSIEWVTKTAFVRGNGTLGELIEYLSRFGTRFTGPIT